jgi:hypothetical protein
MSAASDKAAFMYVFLDLPVLKCYYSSADWYQYLPKAKTIVVLVVCIPWPLEHRSHPRMGARQTPLETAFASPQVHMEESYNRCRYRLHRLTCHVTMEGVPADPSCSVVGWGARAACGDVSTCPWKP